MENNIEICWFPYGELAQDVCTVRTEVFCDEQGYPEDEEFDDTDAVSYHVAVYVNGKAVAAGRMYFDESRIMHLGRIAVDKKLRGSGVGKRVVEEMILKAETMNPAGFELSAQSRVMGFYEKLGFKAVGDEYMDGHVPHTRMQRKARQ